ncbi:MAG: hypothetical protein ACTSWW_07035 [Promethearchaeota archaeon]
MIRQVNTTLEKKTPLVTSLQSFHTTGSIINVKVTFSIPKDKWLARYSTKFPQIQFNLLSTLALSKFQGNCVMQVQGENLPAFWEEFSASNESKRCQIIYQDFSRSVQKHDVLLMNVIFDSPWVLFTIMEPQSIVLFPIVIQKGKLMIDLIAPGKRIDELFKKPYWKPLGLSITHVGKFGPAPKLSSHQQRILNYALEYGLFNIPRDYSLTVAADLISKANSKDKMSVSALSENLRRISKRLSESYAQGKNVDEAES